MSDTLPTLPSATRWTASPQWYPERPDWMADAECRGLDPTVFFTELGESTREVKALCSRCPVRADCLDYALTNGERFGVWGGTSERERKRMRVGRGAIPGRPVDRYTAARRRQVRQMALEGLRASDIARDLGLSRRTVHRYLEEAS